ncbi:MAG: galactose-1-phosphate uridylyltransferase, partial [Oscillospiraceae bacterium]
YPNDFPALMQNPPTPDDVETSLFRVKPAYGRCDVLLYSDQHHAFLKDLSDEHSHKLAHLWQDCFMDFKKDSKIKYAYIFENRGDVVGVTMPHPHGQAYGYPFIPKKLQEEVSSAKEFQAENGKCLFCAMLEEEQTDGRRIIFENEHFVAYLPFFSPVVYGVQITARRHIADLSEMTEAELHTLGETVRDCAGMYDNLFDMAFPYMMCMHNAPINDGEHPEFHFHIEYYPPMRAADKQQFFASSETGAWAWCNPTCPEEKAEELRQAYRRYQAQKNKK